MIKVSVVKDGVVMPTDEQLRIAVCDDEYMSREQNAKMTEMVLGQAGIRHSIHKYESGRELLVDIERGVQFHILLLDVVMEEMDGMELAAALRKQKQDMDIIFVSGDREAALYGYEVSAQRYLAKPLAADKLKEALLYCYHRRQEKREVLLNTAKGIYKINISDIKYVEAFERGTRFALEGEMVDTRLKFSEALERLPTSEFVLCHRAYAVNLSAVKYIRCYEFELKCGETVPIGKARYNEIYNKFVDYLAE